MPFNPFAELKQKTVSLIAALAILAALALGIAFAVQTVRINGFLWLDGLEKRLTNAKATIAQMERASGQAAKDQAAVNHASAARSAAIARKSNHEAPAYYADVRRRADDHAVRLHPAGGSAPGLADLPGTDTPVEGVHGSAGPAELVCRPAVEDGQIVTAAARAAEMHREALDLIAAGVAVSEMAE